MSTCLYSYIKCPRTASTRTLVRAHVRKQALAQLEKMVISYKIIDTDIQYTHTQ